MEEWVSEMMLLHSQKLLVVWDIDYMQNHQIKIFTVFFNES